MASDLHEKKNYISCHYYQNFTTPESERCRQNTVRRPAMKNS